MDVSASARRYDNYFQQEEKVKVREEELLWVRDAVRVHTQLSSVCRLWRGICNQSLSAILGRLNANRVHCQPKQSFPPFSGFASTS